MEQRMVSKCRGLLARNTYLLVFYSVIVSYVWQELIAYLKVSREYFECSEHKEIINVQGDHMPLTKSDHYTLFTWTEIYYTP